MLVDHVMAHVAFLQGPGAHACLFARRASADSSLLVAGVSPDEVRKIPPGPKRRQCLDDTVRRARRPLAR